MPLKEKTARQRNSLVLLAVQYRIPLPVREILQLPNGTCYPICPRCNMTIEREYMCFCDRCGQKLSWERIDFARIVNVPCRRKNGK